MPSTGFLETLEAELRQLDEKREVLLKLIAIEKSQPIPTEPFSEGFLQSASSVRRRVVNAAIELIHRTGHRVTNREILAYVEEKGLSLGSTKNKEASLAAILSQETAKKSARLRRVERGVYDLN